MLISTPEQHIEFLQKQVLGSVKKTFDDNQLLFGFMVMGQAIEILGSYLDDKPMRAKQQSLKRFSIAINRLFPKTYRDANQSSFLYYQLRSCMTHMFVPTARLSLNTGKQTKEKPHLCFKEGVMYLYSEEFLMDFTSAVVNLQNKISTGKLKLKNISSGEINN
jgi:hypothetical protein